MHEFGPQTRPPLFPDSRWTIEQCGMIKVYGNTVVNQQMRREEIGAVDASITETEFRERFGDGDYYLELHPLRGELEGKQKRVSGTGLENPPWRTALIKKLASADIGPEVAAHRSGARFGDELPHLAPHGGSIRMHDPRYSFGDPGGGQPLSSSLGGYGPDQPVMVEIEPGYSAPMPQGLTSEEQIRFIEEARNRRMSEKQREANESLAMRLLLEGRGMGAPAGGSSGVQENLLIMLQGQLQNLNGQLQDAWNRENAMRMQLNDKTRELSRSEGELERARAKITDLEHQVGELQQKLRDSASAPTSSSTEAPAGMVGAVKTLVGMGPALMGMAKQAADIFRAQSAPPAPQPPMNSVSIPTSSTSNGTTGSGFNQ